MNFTIQPGTTPLAFSYVRLSSKKQKDGDGHRRQTDLAKAYCEEKGLTLDHSLEDIGVSGFSGANRIRGVLSRFLALAKAGRIPLGSHLIVESLDRLSRDKVMVALRSFTDILEAGITVHTIADRQVYNWESANDQQGQLFFSLAIMGRAHDESKTKLFRQRENWQEKRAKGRAGGPKLTARGPSWLKLNAARTEFDEIPENVAVIKRIFKESEMGIGCDAIARRLNADGIAPLSFGRTWHGGTVRAYLTSIAVRGHYQPNRMEVIMVDGERTTKRVPDGEVITSYYPMVIDDEQWNRTWVAMDSRRMAGAPNLAGRKGTKIGNLFGSLAHCGRCLQPMNIRDRGKKRRHRTFFMCSGARTGTCPNTWQYVVETWEPAILEFITELDLREIDPVEVYSLESAVAEKKARREALRKRMDALMEMVAEQGSPRARELAGEAERQLDTLQIELITDEEQLRRMRASAPPEDRQAQIRHLKNKMASADAKELYAIRANLQQSLRDVFDYVRFSVGGEVVISLRGGRVGYLFKDGKVFRRIEDLEGLLKQYAA